MYRNLTYYLKTKTSVVLFTILISFSLSSCRGKMDHPFFYSSGEKIELIVVGDTLGVLLRESIHLPNGHNDTSTINIQKLADSLISNNGYASARYLSPKIKLVLSPEKTNSKYKLEKYAQELKSQKYKQVVSNSGYLVRLIKTNKLALLTNEIIIYFKPNIDSSQRNQIFTKFGLEIKERSKFNSQEYLVNTRINSPYEVLKTARKLKEDQAILFAQVNLIFQKTLHEDPDYSEFQWNLENNGSRSLLDADIDITKAWDFSKGSSNITIAVIDDGLDISHTDLKNNIFVNLAELNGSPNDDDDRNGFTDDIYGWDFSNGDGGDNDVTDGGTHGTKVAGVIAAINNDVGINGVCPQCKVLPIKSSRSETEFWRDESAIRYAAKMKARIINCSWGLDLGFVPANYYQIIDSVVNSGVLFVCSMSNVRRNCDALPDLYSIPNVMAISRSNSRDLCDNAGYGNCMSLVAPSAPVNNDESTVLNIYTTDGTGDLGDNMTDPFNPPFQIDQCRNVLTNKDYTGCFWGTSASAPEVAGVGALILSLNPTLTSQQVRYLIQDCADKIDTSTAHYSPKNGYSNFENPTDPSALSTLGYGRLNAFEPLRIVSSDVSQGGLGGVDIFIRDNYLDWGNTEQPSYTVFNFPRDFIPHWKSPDIKIDALADATGINEPNTSEKFEDFITEKPVANMLNKVYIRIRNRGYNTAENVTVKLYWVYGGLALPALWSTFPNDGITTDPNWTSLGSVIIPQVPYSGSSVALQKDAAGVSIDHAQIVSFDFTPPDPSINPVNHYCLLAMVSCDKDPLVSNGDCDLDLVTPNFNNISHKNFQVEPNTEANTTSTLYSYNPYNTYVKTKITIYDPKQILNNISPIFVDCTFIMKPKERVLFTYTIKKVKLNSPTELTFIQEMIVDEKKKRKSKGGYTIYFSQ